MDGLPTGVPWQGELWKDCHLAKKDQFHLCFFPKHGIEGYLFNQEARRCPYNEVAQDDFMMESVPSTW